MTDDDIALWNATIKFVKLAESLEPQLIGCSREQEIEYKAAWKNLRQILYNRMSDLKPIERRK